MKLFSWHFRLASDAVAASAIAFTVSSALTGHALAEGEAYYYFKGADGGSVRVASSWLDANGAAVSAPPVRSAVDPNAKSVLVFTNFTGSACTGDASYDYWSYVFGEGCGDVHLSGTTKAAIGNPGNRGTTWYGGPIRSEATSGTAKFGQAVNLYAGTNLVDVVNAGATIAIHNGLNNGANAVLVKEGQGTFRVPVSYGSAVSNVKEIVLRGGLVLFTAADAKMNLTDCTITFDGNDPSAVLGRSNSGGGQTYTKLPITGGCIRETESVQNTGHGFTDRSLGYTLSLTDNIKSSYFTGSIQGTMSFLWGPSDSSQTFTFAKAAHPTTGAFTVQSGTVALTDGVSFPKAKSLTVKSGATLRAESSLGESDCGASLVVESGATVQIAAGASLRVKAATVAGTSLAAGVYNSSSGWVSGDGSVVVVPSAWPSDKSDIWNRDDYSASLAAGEEVWYKGASVYGSALSLTAGSGAKAIIGASGVTTKGDKATYTWAWPTWLYGAQTWTIAAGDTLDIAAPISTLSPGNLTLAGSGTVAFSADQPLESRIVVSGPKTVRMNGVSIASPWSTFSSGGITFTASSGAENVLDGAVSALNKNTGTSLKFTGGTWRFRGGVSSSAVTFSDAAVIVEGSPWVVGTHQGTTLVNAGPRFQDYGDLTLSAPSNVISILNHAYSRPAGNLTIRTTVPYALYRGTADSSGATRGLQRVALGFNGETHAPNCVWDLCGCDQELSGFPCGVNGATVTSESPAQLHYVLDEYSQNAAFGYVWYAVTNYVQFAGAAGLTYEGTRTDAALVNVSSTTGRLEVASGRLSLLAPGGTNPLLKTAYPGGSWPNASEVAVTGTGTLALGHSKAVNLHCTAFIEDSGKLEITDGVVARCDYLYIDGVKQQVGRTYGATGSGASVIDDVHFAGGGKLSVTGEHPAFVIILK